jgi:hypothetical protein
VVRREKLLAEMVQVVVPWGRLEVLTTPPALRRVARAAHHAAAVRLANEALENAMYDSTRGGLGFTCLIAPRPSGCATGHPSPPGALGLAAIDSFCRDRPG